MARIVSLQRLLAKLRHVDPSAARRLLPAVRVLKALLADLLRIERRVVVPGGPGVDPLGFSLVPEARVPRLQAVSPTAAPPAVVAPVVAQAPPDGTLDRGPSWTDSASAGSAPPHARSSHQAGPGPEPVRPMPSVMPLVRSSTSTGSASGAAPSAGPSAGNLAATWAQVVRDVLLPALLALSLLPWRSRPPADRPERPG
jgi:hypothetical protein